MALPHKNRDGLWIVYHRKSGRVEEMPAAKAKPLLEAGLYVVAPGARPSDYGEKATPKPKAKRARKPKKVEAEAPAKVAPVKPEPEISEF